MCGDHRLPHAHEALAQSFAPHALGGHTRTLEQQKQFVREQVGLGAADIVVIAAPMINFGVPTQLKSWFDYVARAQRTFRYSEAGPQGLVTGKRVIIVSASGGVYSGANAAFDFQVPWLRSMLGFLGMTDVEVIRVEGTALGPQPAQEAVTRAAAQARATVAALAAA
jgi:FMN-dependent NADH-azoreductase